MLAADTFRFLNVTATLETAADWDDPARLRLWRYNLHYFDDLNAADAATRTDWHRALLTRWVRENPPGFGTGWEPYPTSQRLVNWIKWTMEGHALGELCLNSLAVQTRWLRKRLETHLLGNHLWTNAKALVFAGTFYSGSEAAGWLRKGVTLLEAQLNEQVLPDGGHFELSPMYHAIFLEDILDLINLSRVYPDCLPQTLMANLRHAATRMLRWLCVMTHPDGRIALFNDAAFDIAPDQAALVAYAQRLSVTFDERPLHTIEILPDSGYVRLQNARASVICDVACVGPDHLPAHAHADTLAFELSLDGQRILVNGGTSTYEAGPERRRQRGTAAHNTVIVDCRDSSEVWGCFRVARRARPFDVRSEEGPGVLWLEAAHDGYRRLPGRVIHRRRWVLRPEALSVTDRLDGHFTTAASHLQLHPDVTVEPEEDSGRGFNLRIGDQSRIRVSLAPAKQIRSIPSTWHPGFGLSYETTTLAATFAGPSNETRLEW